VDLFIDVFTKGFEAPSFSDLERFFGFYRIFEPLDSSGFRAVERTWLVRERLGGVVMAGQLSAIPVGNHDERQRRAGDRTILGCFKADQADLHLGQRSGTARVFRAGAEIFAIAAI
jgi:hypothetical protein